MVISLRKYIKPVIGAVLLLVLFVSIWAIFTGKSDKYFMGSYLHNESRFEEDYAQPADNPGESDQYSERFQRPSKQPALKLKYSFKDFQSGAEYPPYVKTTFNTPDDVIQAYYAILKEAENMDGYCGGCGTIGQAKTPFPYAYDLLANDTKQKMSLNEYIASFHGIGHTTLLKLIPVYSPPGTPPNIKYYMVEIEVITAPKCSEAGDNKAQPTYFAYYYGLVTVEHTASEGWKIKSVDYIPEDFLCAPYHSWYWDSTYVVRIIFGEWYKLVDEIEKVDIEDSNIKIYAKGGKNRYRFDAVRLTNGEDIFLHEYIWENGSWKEVDYIVEKQKYLKFSILKFQNADIRP